jgi:RNA polymerase sigma factor (sigma-70 family)
MSACIDSSARAKRDAMLVTLLPVLRRYFRRRLASSRADADDLVQEVCIRYLARSERAMPIDELSYLFGIARHVWVDFLADRSRQVARFVSHQDLAPGVLLELGGAVRDPMEDLTVTQLLSKALGRLPKTQKAVLLAHEGEGHSYAEAAAKLGLSIQTVHTYLKLAKSRLRKLNP